MRVLCPALSSISVSRVRRAGSGCIPCFVEDWDYLMSKPVSHRRLIETANMDIRTIPLLKPSPSRLSQSIFDLIQHENSGIYSNFGPINSRFESRANQMLFDGDGECLTSNNATISLMIAIKESIYFNNRKRGRYALIPSFTFAATAHAAMWCGLTPILYDIEPDTWLPSQEAELALLERHGDEIAAIVPYATFGNSLDLNWYNTLATRTGAGIVIDAAASLGSRDANDRAFGQGASMSVIYSMHATKTFATSEGGLIYSADKARIGRMRQMSNFGFGTQRAADMPGLNAKLAELPALLALKKLDEIDAIVARRSALYHAYRANLPDFQFQTLLGTRTAHQFVPALMPDDCAISRDVFITRMKARGIQLGTYFSPHLAQQSYFRDLCLRDDLSVTEQIAARIISFPLFDTMDDTELTYVCDCAIECLG